jgi:hypothetical protein
MNKNLLEVNTSISNDLFKEAQHGQHKAVTRRVEEKRTRRMIQETGILTRGKRRNRNQRRVYEKERREGRKERRRAKRNNREKKRREGRKGKK